MALVRCDNRHREPKGRTVNYVAYVKPKGYPETALICGLCDKPGIMWLSEDEAKDYERGERIFKGPNAFTNMRAGDEGITRY